MRNVEKCVEKIKAHTLWSIHFLRKFCHFWDDVEKYSTARHATCDYI